MLDVLRALSTIQDPDLGQDIVACGFVKKLEILPKEEGGQEEEKGEGEEGEDSPNSSSSSSAATVSFELRLTTPACPIKEQFRSDSAKVVGELGWVEDARDVFVTISSSPAAAPPSGQPSPPSVDGEDSVGGGSGSEGRPGGLSRVRHVIAVSSCKGGVGKSTVAVNLAFTLLQMGARGVGIFDADIYGPSLPTMVSPLGDPVLGMDPVTRQLTPVTARIAPAAGGEGSGGEGGGGEGEEQNGIKCVSFGWAGQGAAIMRGPMASGVVAQLLTTSDWGDLDYLVVDFPPGTGDVQLTLCQTVAFDAAVVGMWFLIAFFPPPIFFCSPPPPPQKKPKKLTTFLNEITRTKNSHHPAEARLRRRRKGSTHVRPRGRPLRRRRGEHGEFQG